MGECCGHSWPSALLSLFSILSPLSYFLSFSRSLSRSLSLSLSLSLALSRQARRGGGSWRVDASTLPCWCWGTASNGSRNDTRTTCHSEIASSPGACACVCGACVRVCFPVVRDHLTALRHPSSLSSSLFLLFLLSLSSLLSLLLLLLALLLVFFLFFFLFFLPRVGSARWCGCAT